MSNKEITILKDYWDLRSERIQVVTGLFLSTMAIIAVWLLADRDFANSIAHQYSISLINIYGTAQSTSITEVLAGFDANYLTVPRLIIHISTGFIAGLIALEITKLYGNRWGVLHSVWVALIYIVCPTTVMLMYAGDGLLILLGALFSNLSIYLDFRYRSLEEEFYLISSALLLTVSICFDVVAGLTALAGIMISRLVISKLRGKAISKSFKMSYLAILIPVAFIILQNNGLRDGFFSPSGMQDLLYSLAVSPEHLIAHSRTLITLFLVSVIVIGTLTAFRIIAGTLWLRPIIFLLLWLGACFLIAGYYILGAHYLSDTSVAVSTLIFYVSPPLVILICLTALPAIDAVNKPVSVALSACGCLCLSLLFVFWGTQMYKAQSKQVTIQEKFRLYETIAKQEANAYPDRNLVLIGMPEIVAGYVKEHKMHLSKRRMTSLFEAIKAERKKGFALVNDLGFKITNPIAGESGDTVYLRWSDRIETFEPVSYRGRFNLSLLGNAETARMISVEPANTPVLTGFSPGTLGFDSPYIEYGPDQLTVVANRTPFTLWLPAVDLNPAYTNHVEISGSLAGGKETKGKVSLIWKSENGKTATAELMRKKDGSLYANLFRQPDWMNSSRIKKVGIKFEPGRYHMHLNKLSFEKEMDLSS